MGKRLTEPKVMREFIFFPKILSSFKRLKIFSDQMYLNNTRSNCAIKPVFLDSIKSEQVSEMCSIVSLYTAALNTSNKDTNNYGKIKYDFKSNNKELLLHNIQTEE